jgi:hypothetical protein
LVRRFQARFGGSEAAASLLFPFWNISLKRLVSTCSKHQMLKHHILGCAHPRNPKCFSFPPASWVAL